MSELLLSATAFVFVASAIYVIGTVIVQRNDPIRRRLMRVTSTRRGDADQRRPATWLQGAYETVTRLVGGVPGAHTPGTRTLRQKALLLAVVGITATGGAVSAMWVANRLFLIPPAVLAAGILAGWAAAWLALRFWLRRQAQFWLEEINNNLIDVIDLWVLCLGAGMSFQSALVRVAQDATLTTNALREELLLTNQEIVAGAPREEALRNLVRRCGNSGDLRALVSHIIQSERLGSSLTQTLRVYSDTLRSKRREVTRELIQTLPLKLVFPLIFCILPALFVVILGPSIIGALEALK